MHNGKLRHKISDLKQNVVTILATANRRN